MHSRTAPAIALLLAGSLCLLPFLNPDHQLPLLPEWLAVTLGIAATISALASRGVASMPAPAPWLVVFALLLTARAAFGEHAYAQTSLLAALYVVYALLLIWLGAQLANSLGLERVALVLAAFLLAGALANAAAGIVQFYGRPALLEDLIANLRGNRAYGNIAQANLYADYLALGEGSLLFLWLRARVRTQYALCGLALLAAASALSGSRGAALYLLRYAVLGFVAMRLHDNPETRRLAFAACVVAAVGLVAHSALPWVNSELGLGPPAAPDRLLDPSGNYHEPRAQAFVLALRAWWTAPMLGVGIGEFPGVAFALGLEPSLTGSGEVWTSPHNLALHLLAETGIVGAVLVMVGLGVWGWGATRRFWVEWNPALWWVLAAAGIGLIHSMTEFPFWSAHFLGVSALLIGASSKSSPVSPAAARGGKIGAFVACAMVSAVVAITVRDYVRLDAARITGTRLTLAPAAQAERDAEIMRGLARGFLAPVAELSILLGAPLDRSDLSSKLAMSQRVARFWPTYAVVTRRAALLALDARGEEAKSLLQRTLHSFPQRRDDTISILERAGAADPSAIEPLLAMARAAPSPAIESRR